MTNEEPTLNYFAILGVSEDASLDEIESRYQELAGYLASPDVPDHLREWAGRQAALVDEAYAVLLDPDRRAAASGGEAAIAAATEPAPAPEAPERKVAPARPRSTQAGRRQEAPGRKLSPLLVGILGGVAVVALFFGGQMLLDGGDDDDSGDSAATGEQGGVPLDTKRINELIAQYQKDPTNAEVLFELGESFFQANQYEKTIEWFTRLLAVDPNNVHARTDIGTAQFNMGRVAEAKKTWLDALKIAPDDVQLHFNMGFLYFNAEPPDMEAARTEWELVLKLETDPNSSLARTASAHLGAIAGATKVPGAGTTPGASSSPVATPSPRATP